MDGSASPPRRAHTVNFPSSTPTSPPRSQTHIPKHSTSRPVHIPGFVLSANTPRRILLPTTRLWPPPLSGVAGRRAVSGSSSRPSRRHASLDLTASHQSGTSTPTFNAREPAWIQHLAKLNVQIVESGVQMYGYQVFLVEQWLVDRSKVVRTVTVYTGNPKDKIFVTVLGRTSQDGVRDDEDLFQKTLFEFRKDGARPRETEKGVICVTSLASFRSDLNIVHVPNGDVLPVLADMYVNINLQRLGASGRSALNLDEPSASSKEKFLQMYNLPEAGQNTSSKMTFKDAVLELVRAVQTALALFGMYTLAPDERDGLICDNTVKGMQRWMDVIGINLRLEPLDGVLDPPVVAALLGSVASLRSKLAALAIPQVPKDPFLDPLAFLHSIPSARHNHRHTPSMTLLNASPPAPSEATLHYIDLDTLKRVHLSYAKTRTTDGYKVHRVLKNKIDDLTTASTSLATNLNLSLRTNAPSDSTSTHHGHSTASTSGTSHTGGMGLSLGGLSSPTDPDTLVESEITDLDSLVRILINPTSKSDVPPSLRDLWAGRPGYHRQARENEIAASMASLSARYPFVLGGHWDDEAGKDGKDETYAGIFLRGAGAKVRDKGHALKQSVAGWTGIDGISRKNKHSIDGAMESDTSGHAGAGGGKNSLLPSVVITSDKSPVGSDQEGDLGHNGPYNTSPAPSISYRSPTSSVSNLNLSDYDRGIRRFNHVAAPLDVVSLRAVGVTHSDPTAPTLARLRVGTNPSTSHAHGHVHQYPTALALAHPLLVPGADNVRAAASLSAESIAISPTTSEGAINARDGFGMLGTAFMFPASYGEMPMRKMRQRWRRKFAGRDGGAVAFNDDSAMGLGRSEAEEEGDVGVEGDGERDGEGVEGSANGSGSGSGNGKKVVRVQAMSAAEERRARLRRRASISHCDEYDGYTVLDPRYMQIDVEIAYQLVLLDEKATRMRQATEILEALRLSMDDSRRKLASSLAPQKAALPELTSRLTTLTEHTRSGRTDASMLKRRAETSRYQAERLVEGAERLDLTLGTYKKRMDDVESAVAGLYSLDMSLGGDADGDGEADDEAASGEGEDDAEDEGGSIAAAAGGVGSWWDSAWLRWIPIPYG